MTTVWYAASVMLVGSLLAVFVMAWIASRSEPIKPTEEVVRRFYTIRRGYFFSLLFVLFVFLIITFSSLPYHRLQKITPDIVVSVKGRMWSWEFSLPNHQSNSLSKTQRMLTLPAHRSVEFQVTSEDVNHGFGIYDAQGRLLAQTQAMPGYTNHLFYTFDQPGQYTVLCLEYCGVAHHLMMTHFTVE